MSAKLFRIALVLEGEYVSAWQHLMLEHLQAVKGFSLVAVIFRKPQKLSFWQRAGLAWFHILQKLDGVLFKMPLTAQVPVSVLSLFGDISMCDAGSKRYQELFTSGPVDVVIDLSGQEPLAETILWAKHGVWRYFFGRPASLSDHYVGIREYAACKNEIVSGLERIMESGSEPDRLFYATTSTDPGSVNRGIERTLWKMADFIPQRLQELQQVGDTAFYRNVQGRLIHFPLVQTYESRFPIMRIMLQMVLRYPLNFMRKFYLALFRFEQWVLLVGEHGDMQNPSVLERFHKLMPQSDRFWADPFVIEHEGRQYVFFEEMLYERGIGHLAYIRLESDGAYSGPVRILEKPYHLSYPFVFNHQGQYYMIPETAANRTVELYRCESFPERWVFEKNLMENVEAYDATLLEKEGNWWMFVSMRTHENCSPNEALYLFRSDSPLSTDWQPHPQNPVVTRASHARPAGRIFESEGELYRPSQNCAGTYGRGLNINLINQLDEKVYREETISLCLPDGDYDMNGVHTVGFGGKVMVADAVHVHRRLGVLDRWLEKIGGFFNRVGVATAFALLTALFASFWVSL